jgi:hypothetical protein
LKGFIENLEQFDVLLGQHQTVSHNGIIEKAETGFGSIVSYPFNLNFIKKTSTLITNPLTYSFFHALPVSSL